MKNKKAQGVPWVLISFLLALITAAIVGYIIYTTYFQEGGETLTNLIRTPGDLDGDGIPNARDMCSPAACTPLPSEMDDLITDSSNPRFGCLPSQGITRQPWAEMCNPYVEEDEEAMIA